jgi:hypothetical protein
MTHKSFLEEYIYMFSFCHLLVGTPKYHSIAFPQPRFAKHLSLYIYVDYSVYVQSFRFLDHKYRALATSFVRYGRRFARQVVI